MIAPPKSVKTKTDLEGNASYFNKQKREFYQYLYRHTVTASMASDATGIYQKNICRYKRDLQKAGVLWEVRKGICQMTGFPAMYLTTNPDLAPMYPQDPKTAGNGR